MGDGPQRTLPLDSVPVAALLQQGDRIVAVNPAYERFMGAPAATIVGRSVTDLIGQFVGTADRSLVGAAAEAQAAGTKEEGQLWIRVQDAHGQPRSIRVDWKPTGNPGESVVYLVDAEAEATAKAATEGLARAAGELGRCEDEREVLEKAADVLHARGLIVTTLLLRRDDPLLEYGPMRRPRDSGYERISPEPLRATRPAREVLWKLNPEFDLRRAVFFQDVAPLIDAAYPGPVGARLQAVVTQRRTVQAPLFVNDRPYGALVLTGDDLTPALAGSFEMFAELVARAIENVRLRTELVQRERLAALGEAAAVMAHEVRNPIAAILNAGSLLRKQALDGATLGALLEVIGEEAHRLDRLVTDLLDLGRPLTPRIRTVDLHELAQRSVRLLADRGETKEVDVVFLEPDEPIRAALDPDLAQLAVSNVVRNAVQASPPGGKVTVSVEDRDERGALVVDDEGPGFPAEHVERLLEPFHTTRATGTGIGLAVVRRVMDACRGEIEIGSAAGGGGRFVMIFPVSAPESVRSPARG